MLEFWSELPWYVRIGAALAVAVIGVLLFLFVNIRVGVVITGLGAIMLCIGGRSNSEKNGYNF